MKVFFGKDDQFHTFFLMIAFSWEGFVISLGWLVLSVAWAKEKTN